MRRSLLLLATMALALLMVSSVAQAASPKAKCLQEATSLGLSLDGYNSIYGNNKTNDFTSQATAGPDLFCGLGGNDRVLTLDAGDIFVGGAGDDYVNINFGTFIGGAGNDRLDNSGPGTSFYGGAGDDNVYGNEGTFYGGDGNDSVYYNYAGAFFYGGDGNDSVTGRNFGTTDSVENGV